MTVAIVVYKGLIPVVGRILTNEYLGAYHSERRSIREQYGNWGDTPMKDVMENVFNDGFIW